MRIIFAISALFFVGLISDGYCLQIFNTKTVFHEAYDNKTLPADVAFNDGNVVVYDAMGGKLMTYKNKSLQKTTQNNEFIGGVCLVKLDNEFYLCDGSKNRVLVLGNDFDVKSKISAAKFDPTDVVRNVKGNENDLLIIDNDNHRVDVYDTKTGKFLEPIGKGRGAALGYFNYPFSAAQDKDGYTYLSDVINTRVQMLTPERKPTLAFGEWGVKSGQMFRPKGIAIFDNKYVLVSDGYIGAIQVFDMKGNFVGVIGDEDGKIKRYSSPTRIRINGKQLAVIDPYDRVVDILDLGELK